jgi:DNA-nicking Smr family endonuclease
MACLGVRRLKDGEQNIVASAEKAKPNTTSAAESQRDESDLNTFLDAIGSMKKVFKDEWCEGAPDKRAVPRRMKQVERGQLKPQEQLDLHGMTIDEATAKVLFFLQNAIFQGFSTILLITGKGLHSEGGPVLRSAMESLLNEKKEQVVEWGVAPRRYGGEGALVVFLRQSGQKNP